MLKSEALKKYCLKYNLRCGGYLTEKTIDISKYGLEYILKLKNDGCLLIDIKNLEKLKRNII